MEKRACIIAVGKWGTDKCLLKNRDRNYIPKVKIIHEIRDGVEILYMTDTITGWCEGLNEYKIGVVNSALQVARDEAEKEVAKNVGKKSKDGPRILKTLECKTLKEALSVAKSYEGGLKGHTIVADLDTTYSIESTSKHESYSKKIPESHLVVKTNHGLFYDDAGYQDGDDYTSSVTRRDDARKNLKKIDKPEDIALALMHNRNEVDDPNNMVRDTENMSTTSQMILNLTKGEMLFYVIPGKLEFLGYEDKTGKKKKKLRVRVFEYENTSKDEPGVSQILKKATLKQYEKEEEEDERLISPSPKKKPPRNDLKRRRVEDEDNDPDRKQDEIDRSHNYKRNASLISRIVFKKLAEEHTPGKVWETEEGFAAMNQEGKPQWGFSSREKAEAYANGEKDDEITSSDTEDVHKTEDVSEKERDGNKPEDIHNKEIDPKEVKREEIKTNEHLKEFSSIVRSHAASLSLADKKQLIERLSNKEKELTKTWTRALNSGNISDFDRARTNSKRINSKSSTEDVVTFEAYKQIEKKLSEISEGFKEDANNKIGDTDASALLSSISDPLHIAAFTESLDNHYPNMLMEAKKFISGESTPEFEKELKEAKKLLKQKKIREKDPFKLGKAAAILAAFQKMDNPLVRFKISDNDSDFLSLGSDENSIKLSYLKSNKQSHESFNKTKSMSSEEIDHGISFLKNEIDQLEENSPRRIQAEAILQGMKIGQIIHHGDEVKGISPSLVKLIQAADKTRNLDFFLDMGDGSDSYLEMDKKTQAEASKIMSRMTNSDLLDFVGDDHPFHDLAKKTFVEGSPMAVAFMRANLQNTMIAHMKFVDKALIEQEGLESQADIRSEGNILLKEAMNPDIDSIDLDSESGRSLFAKMLEKAFKLLAKLFKRTKSRH